MDDSRTYAILPLRDQRIVTINENKNIHFWNNGKLYKNIECNEIAKEDPLYDGMIQLYNGMIVVFFEDSFIILK